MFRPLSCLVLLIAAGHCQAQNAWNVLTPDSTKVPPRKMLSTYLLAEAQKQFNARKAEVAKLKTPDDVHKRQEILRARMIEALGGFPAKTPLNAKIVGKEQRDGYRIEKIIYESRPNHHVTATLYLPDGKGPFPGVLMPIGHSTNGKAADYIQRGSILLAKNGIAVLPYDPIGQGERRQLLEGPNKAAIPNSTSEHTLVGVGAFLVGQGTATYRIWDGMRGLDYLESRPEIDAKRLGCTGCSGGGTLTSYLMALDERIACAAPSCYITSLERLFATIGPQDAEQNIIGQVALGIDHADYISMRAPRPTLMATATQDFFDIQGSWTSFREATQIYGILGYGERVNLVEYNTKHGYPKPQREAVTRWMSRWLLNKDVPIVESAFAIAKDVDLQCTRSGQVLEDFKGKSVFHINAEYEAKYAKERTAKLAKQTRAQTLTDVRKLIGLPDKINRAKYVQVDLKQKERKGGNVSIVKAIFETEPGIQVPALIFHPDVKENHFVFYVNGLGKAADIDAITKYVDAGKIVVALDLRGMGEVAPSAPSAKPSYFGNDFKETFLGFHLNRPLLGQRVYDLLSIIEFYSTAQNRTLTVVGVNSAGPLVLHAAALDPRIDAVTLDHSLVSWASVVRSPINYNQLTNVVPGALKSYDLPDLATLIAPRPLTMRAAWNPKGEPVTQKILDEAYANCREAYALRNASTKLILAAAK